MRKIEQTFSISYRYAVHFTQSVFDRNNRLLADTLANSGPERKPVLFVIDAGVVRAHSSLPETIKYYAKRYSQVFELAASPLIVQGGETVKNDRMHVQRQLEMIEQHGLCRHSTVVAIGGGAVLDLIGFATSIAHRGIQLIRIPTTVLSQNDSGVGVKNGVNFFGKKNFLGSFAPPHAVINDSNFLTTLEYRDWIAGVSEAIKVALIKDASFFNFIEFHAVNIRQRDMTVMNELIFRCAELHLDHIREHGDPFELGSSRPLDFGHWAAHKLEHLSAYELRHGEAVAMGIALDATYSYLSGLLGKAAWERIISLFIHLDFVVYDPELLRFSHLPEHPKSIFSGLEEFREHLGGRLTVMLLEEIGSGVEVHAIDIDQFREAIFLLRDYVAQQQEEAEMMQA